jgi:hypothetical protein
VVAFGAVAVTPALALVVVELLVVVEPPDVLLGEEVVPELVVVPVDPLGAGPFALLEPRVVPAGVPDVVPVFDGEVPPLPPSVPPWWYVPRLVDDPLPFTPAEAELPAPLAPFEP